jgi:hypothetical protein
VFVVASDFTVGGKMAKATPRSFLECINEKGELDEEAWCKYITTKPTTRFLDCFKENGDIDDEVLFNYFQSQHTGSFGKYVSSLKEPEETPRKVNAENDYVGIKLMLDAIEARATNLKFALSLCTEDDDEKRDLKKKYIETISDIQKFEARIAIMLGRSSESYIKPSFTALNDFSECTRKRLPLSADGRTATSNVLITPQQTRPQPLPALAAESPPDDGTSRI